MRHINLKAIKKLARDQNLTIKNNNSFRIDQCPECLEGKMILQKYKISLSNIKTIEYLDLVSSDICSLINLKTWDNYKYFITFLDKSTRFLEVILLKKKSKALNAFKVYKAKAKNQSNKRIKRLRTNNNSEYVNTNFKYTLNKFSILHKKTAPYTKEPNSLIEHINLTLLNKVRSIIYTANLPRYLWREALNTAIFLYNRTPHSALDLIIPFKALNKSKPIISNIKVFSSLYYYKDNSFKLKLDPRGRKAILIRYSKEANLYKIQDLNKNRPIWTRDIKVFKNIFLQPYTAVGDHGKSAS